MNTRWWCSGAVWCCRLVDRTLFCVPLVCVFHVMVKASTLIFSFDICFFVVVFVFRYVVKYLQTCGFLGDQYCQ